MTPPNVYARRFDVRVMLASLLCALPWLTGCGTGSYQAATDKSMPELELRSKFSALDMEYVKFPDFPVSFRVPNVFVKSDEKNQHWKIYGKTLKLGSMDPLNPDSVIPLPTAYVVAPEFFDASLNPAHQGTFLTEYKLSIEDPTQGNKASLFQHLMMTIWIFDATNKARPVPNEATVLLGVKGRGKEQLALASANAALKKAEKPLAKLGAWEPDDIAAAPGAGGATIQAKLARFYVRSAFLSGSDDINSRRPVEKDGVVRLWSFRLDNRYQVYLMLRAPLEMTGDSGDYQFENESLDSDKLVELGRAVIGSMVVSQPPAAEGEAAKKK